MPSDCPEDEFAPLMEKLTDGQILACETAATDRLFNFRFPGLAGRYGILNRELARHEATVEQMRQDAARFSIDPAGYQDCWQDMLLEQLSEAWDEEFYGALLITAQGRTLHICDEVTPFTKEDYGRLSAKDRA